MKNCPLCHKNTWDYDVVTLEGSKWCGTCFWYMKQEANRLKKPLPMNKANFALVLKSARQAKAEGRVY
jgi:hypothetical protein